jgi:hypothetical protein
MDSEGSQVESLGLNLCQIDFRLRQDDQPSFSCEHEVGRGRIQEYLAKEGAFCVPNLQYPAKHTQRISCEQDVMVREMDEHGPHPRYQTKRSLAYRPVCHPVCPCRNMQTLVDSQKPE